MNLVRSGALALAAGLVVIAPTSAYAGSSDHADGSGDVSALTFGSSGVSETTDPAQAEGDILSTRTVHGARRVTIAVRYRQLSQTGEGVTHDFGIWTNKGRFREIAILGQPGHWQGRRVVLDKKGHRVSCRGVHWSIRYAADTALVSVPRRCLANPRWVRVSVVSISGDDSTFYLDDANTTKNFGDDPVRGPRVYR